MCAYTFNRPSQDGVDLVSGDVAAVSPADVLVDADDAEVGLDPAQEGDNRTAAVGRHTVHGVGLTGQWGTVSKQRLYTKSFRVRVRQRNCY